MEELTRSEAAFEASDAAGDALRAQEAEVKALEVKLDALYEDFEEFDRPGICCAVA